TRAVAKRGKPPLASRRADTRRVALIDDDAAGAVVRVLHLHDRRRWIQHVIARLDRGDELVCREAATRADLGELHAGVGGAATRFMPDGVRLAADDDVVAGARQRAKR